MNTLKITLGILFVLAAIVGGLYVSIGYCLIGGIVSLIHGCQANPIDAFSIAYGIVRIVFTAVAGWATFFICITIGGIFFVSVK